MIDIIHEIKGFLLRHKQYVINILYSGHTSDPDQYYFRLLVDGSRCMLIINNETIMNMNPESVMKKLSEGFTKDEWRDEHVLMI